jgi:hypothetical protein
MTDPNALLFSVAGHGLPSGRATAPAIDGTGPLDPGTWDALLALVVEQRVTGHLVAAIDDGALRADDEQYDDAYAAHHRGLARDLVLERLLVTTCARFDAAGIVHRALKGAALAHTVYADPARRSYGDVDVLVRGDHYDRAVDLLTATPGAHARYREPRPGFTRRYGKGVCVVDGGHEIDVHRSFVAGPFGIALRTDDLFADGQPVRLGGREVVALGPLDQFLHACYHVALGGPTPGLVAMRDVAEMLFVARVDIATAIDRAAGWQARAVVQRAVTCTWDAFGLPPDHAAIAWARAYQPTRFERDAMSAYTGTGRSYGTQALAGVRALPGTRDRARYVGALLFPNRQYARERDGYVARWRRIVSTQRGAEQVR